MQFMKQRKWTSVKSKDRAFLGTQFAGIESKISLILQQVELYLGHGQVSPTFNKNFHKRLEVLRTWPVMPTMCLQ
jgi:hypothetical protein